MQAIKLAVTSSSALVFVDADIVWYLLYAESVQLPSLERMALKYLKLFTSSNSTQFM